MRELVATLQKCRHQAFPVTPEVEAAYQSGEVRRASLCTHGCQVDMELSCLLPCSHHGLVAW